MQFFLLKARALATEFREREMRPRSENTENEKEHVGTEDIPPNE